MRNRSHFMRLPRPASPSSLEVFVFVWFSLILFYYRGARLTTGASHDSDALRVIRAPFLCSRFQLLMFLLFFFCVFFVALFSDTIQEEERALRLE